MNNLPFSPVNVNLNIPLATEPVLTEASVTFFTYDGGDDKDADSWLKITFYADYGSGFIMNIASRDREKYGKFDDHNGGSVNTIMLNVNGVLPLSSLSNARLKLEFDPNGDDTWKFHYTLNLKFSNGIVLSRERRDCLLSDGTRVLDQ